MSEGNPNFELRIVKPDVEVEPPISSEELTVDAPVETPSHLRSLFPKIGKALVEGLRSSSDTGVAGTIITLGAELPDLMKQEKPEPLKDKHERDRGRFKQRHDQHDVATKLSSHPSDLNVE